MCIRDRVAWCIRIKWSLWTQHVNAISSKVAWRMNFLKLLKRSGTTLEDLFCGQFLNMLAQFDIRVWRGHWQSHWSLYKEGPCGLSHLGMATMATISASYRWLAWILSKNDEKHWLKNCMFEMCQDSESSLHYLLPAKRDMAVTSKLRHTRNYELIMSQTEKFRKSFIPYSIARY